MAERKLSAPIEEGPMRSIHLAGAMLALAVIGTQPAIALPKPASGSNCSSDWVNNPGAMQCFIQGENDVHAGVAHPHYVACLAGETYCCVDNNHGGQDCESQARTTGGKVGLAALLKAVLAAQQAHAVSVERFSKVPAHPAATGRAQ
jgi:hypothetical protein